MISLSLVLLVIGLLDLYSGGLAGTPENVKKSRILVLALLLSSLASCFYWLNTNSPQGAVLLLLASALGTSTWMLARLSEERHWQMLAIGALLAAIAVSALVVPVIAQEAPMVWLGNQLERTPWESLAGLNPNKVLLLVSLLVFLGPTSNGLVRCCLLVVRETPVAESEKTLKGGRVIGPLERFLIFGLALAGQPTAAALIISAKSIIRFPELQSKSQGGTSTVNNGGDPVPTIDELTEYFLLGSLLSWSLALVAALPFQ